MFRPVTLIFVMGVVFVGIARTLLVTLFCQLVILVLRALAFTLVLLVVIFLEIMLFNLMYIVHMVPPMSLSILPL